MNRTKASSIAATSTNESRNVEKTRASVAWGKLNNNRTGALIFAALLVVCSSTVGCSSDQPKPSISKNQSEVTPSAPPVVSTNLPPALPEAKPAARKVVRKRPATVNFADKTYGVSFDYPRRYAIETGPAATDLVDNGPVPMNFVQPGGLTLAAVELPQTGLTDTDFSYAFFNVSVNKTLTADQCAQFATPQPKPVAASEGEQSAAETAKSVPSDSASPAPADAAKLMLGDLSLIGSEAVSGEGTRQSDVKYFHTFQNGACYEFAMNVTTVARETEGGMKHIDRDKIFSRLEQILATVKINPLEATPEVTASAPASDPAAAAVPQTPAQ